jgi:fibronectin-binding autotransporter adhesin
MKSPAYTTYTRRRAALALIAAFSALSPLSAANLTWDIDPGTAGNQAGSGTWDLVTNNWNNGTSNVLWTGANATLTDSAQFTGTDVAEDTYTITLAKSVGVANTNSGLRFSATGYNLVSDNSTRVITLTTIAVDGGKRATITGPLTIQGSGAFTFAGYGTLSLRGNTTVNGTGNTAVNSGNTLRITDNSTLNCAGSLIVGNLKDTPATEVIVDGGTILVPGATNSIIVSNLNSTTGNATTRLTLNAGLIRVSNLNAGLRLSSGNSNGNQTATFNLNGGVITVARVYETTASAPAISTFNFNGGTLQALATTANGATFLNGLDAANVKTGGAVIDTNGANITVGQALIAELDGGGNSTGGGLTKIANGTLTLTGNNTYTGNTTASAGTLAISAPYSALSATTLASGARLQITSGPSASVLPALTLQGGSGLVLNLGSYNPSNLSSASFAALNASGNFTVSLSGSNIPVGNYTVATYASKTGTGSAGVGTLPPGVTATLNYTDTSLMLNVLTPQVPTYVWASTSGNWDLASSNWNLGLYTEGGVVTFPNIAGDNTITLLGSRSPFSVEFQNTGTNTYRIEGSAIAGSATLTKSGTGTVTLAATNSYSGATNVNAGLLLVTENGALGSASGGTVVASGASIGLDGGVTYSTAEPITLSGSGYTTALGFIAATRGALQAVTGACTYAGPISLGASGARFGVQNQTGASLTLSGTISPAPGVTDSSVYFRAGNVDGNYIILTGENNSWQNTASIYANPSSGTSGVRLGRTNALPTTASIVAGGTFTSLGTTLDLNGYDQTLPGLVESDGYLQIANLKSGTTSVVTLNTSLADYSTVAGLNNLEAEFTTISDGEGTTALVKKGSFKQTLDGVQTYSGPTTIEAGTLAFTGTGFLQATPITMLSGSTLDVSTIGSVALPRTEFAISGGLSGSGSLTATGKTVTVSNTFAPGALAVSGNLTLASGTATTLVASTTPGVSSLVAVTDGSLVLDGNLAINPAGGFSFASGQTFTFATGTVVAGLDGVTISGNALSGVSGVWTGSIGGLDYTFTESNATLVVSGGVVISPLQAWRDVYFPAAGNDGTGIGANDADPDGDGIDNLVEYATNTSPVASNASAVVAGTNAGRLTLTFPRIDDPTLRYTVEGRDDLVTGTWASITPAAPATNNPTFGFTGVTPGATETVSETVIDSVTIPAPGKRFLRLSVDFVE